MTEILKMKFCVILVLIWVGVGSPLAIANDYDSNKNITSSNDKINQSESISVWDAFVRKWFPPQSNKPNKKIEINQKNKKENYKEDELNKVLNEESNSGSAMSAPYSPDDTVGGKPNPDLPVSEDLKSKNELPKKYQKNTQVEDEKILGPNLKIELNNQKIKRAQRPDENKKILAQIHQYQKEIKKLCEEIGHLLGSVSVKGCLSHNFSHGGAYSVKNRALIYKDIYPNGVSSDQANKLSKILVIGGIHGDEYSSFSIIFRWLERLAKDKKNIQQYWRFIPAANPDGLLSFKPAQRMNANGVDLNRNFLTNDWRDKAVEYWETKTGKDARRNPGKTAASEPETIWLSGLIEQWQPDVIVSVHAPYGILDFDSTDRADVRAPNKIGMLHLKLLGTYPGSLGRYAALNRGIPVLTMELPHAGIMPSQSEQEHLWQDLQRWLNQNI